MVVKEQLKAHEQIEVLEAQNREDLRRLVLNEVIECIF